MIKCNCCNEKIYTINEIKERLNSDLEEYLEEISNLEWHNSLDFQERNDFYDIPFLSEIIKEFQKRIKKIRLKGEIRLMRMGCLESEMPLYYGIALCFEEYYFHLDLSKKNIRVALVPNITTELLEQTEYLTIEKELIKELYQINGCDHWFHKKAMELYDIKKFPIGEYFGDLIRFLEVVITLSFNNDYVHFYNLLADKIDGVEKKN